MKASKLDKEVEVAVQKDHLRKIARIRHPIQAVEELIWNGLDADATKIDVEIENNQLGGIERIRVKDNGVGMLPEFAVSVFEKLGGSWKQYSTETASGRKYHGKHGQGRFTAFSLGMSVSWRSVSQDEKKAYHECIVSSRGDLIDRFHVEGRKIPRDEMPVARGTVVTVEDVPEDVHGLIGEGAITALQDKFALYLVQYPQIAIRYDGEALDASQAIAHRKGYFLVVEVDKTLYEAEVEVIEWMRPGPRGIFLCGESGFSIMQVAAGVNTQGRRVTAHVRSAAFDRLRASGELTFEDLHPVIRGLVNATREKVESYAREAAVAESTTRVEHWKTDDVYPYEAPPSNPVETAQQEVFNTLAREAEKRVPEIRSQGRVAKRLLFRLLRDAVDRGPEQVQEIFRQVLELSDDQQAELASLLGKTTLSAIVSSAKIVADRLDFLNALEMLVYDYTKDVKERGELQKLIEANAWIFGEEFALAGSEISLNSVLRVYADRLREDFSDDHVESVRGKKSDIVDLILARSVPYRQGKEHHFLVVELKRPSRTLDQGVYHQTLGYAVAVANDVRFQNRNVRWSFWMVGTGMDTTVQELSRRKDAPAGRVTELKGNVELWAFTWGELINESRSRMEFFRENLEYAVTGQESLESVRAKYPNFVTEKAAAKPTGEGAQSDETKVGRRAQKRTQRGKGKVGATDGD